MTLIDAYHGTAAKQDDYDKISGFAFALISHSIASMSKEEAAQIEDKLHVVVSGFIDGVGCYVGLTVDECVETMLVYLTKQLGFPPDVAADTIVRVGKMQKTPEGDALMRAGGKCAFDYAIDCSSMGGEALAKEISQMTRRASAGKGMQQTQDFQCPTCGAEQQVTTWSSVRGNKSPALKASILNGTFFRHSCDECGTPIDFTYPVLYHDTDRQLAVSLCETEIDHETKDAMDSFGKQMPASYRLRVVYSLEELAETITIFDNNLNDWFIHIVKMSVAEQVKTTSDRVRLATVTTKRGEDFEFAFNLPDQGRSVVISGVADPLRTSKQWDELESELDWVHVSETNFYPTMKLFMQRFP